MAQRAVPQDVAQILFHPESDAEYIHFEGAAEHRFQSESPAFNRTNAWWLAEAALLAYWNDRGTAENPGAAARFEGQGTDLKYHRFLSGPSTQCHIVVGDDFAIVSFRGTQPNNWPDFLADAKCLCLPWMGPGWVHCGFRDALKEIWEDLSKELNRFRRKGATPRKVWFTGHSLGAALAVLAAQLFDETQGIYTIGCPLVGDGAFCTAFTAANGNSFRYANGNDVVTHIPPHGLFHTGYQPVPQLKHIDSDGRIEDSTPSRFLEFIKRELNNSWQQIKALNHFKLDLLPAWLKDHTPKVYSARIWNDLDANG